MMVRTGFAAAVLAAGLALVPAQAATDFIASLVAVAGGAGSWTYSVGGWGGGGMIVAPSP